MNIKSKDLFQSQSAGEMLGTEGPFIDAVSGFSPREQQQQLANYVADAIEQQHILIAEAGTGTGKTFAYLVPALQSNKRVIISTGTKTLQDQLFKKDIPVVRDALKRPVSVALLKGRANYLCQYRQELSESEGRFSSRAEVGQLKKITSWSKRTKSGDIAEVTSVPEDALIWSKVTSTSDNCLGKDCAYFNDCFLQKARRKAQDSDIIVVNHYLLFADMAIKETGFSEILPSADAFLIDEAHQIPEIASDYFGVSFSSRQIMDLVRDTEIEFLREAGEQKKFIETLDLLKKSIQDLRLSFGLDPMRVAWDQYKNENKITILLGNIDSLLKELKAKLEPLAQRGKGLENCLHRVEEIIESFELFEKADDGSENVQWLETFTKAFILRTTPLDISKAFQDQLEKYSAAWVFTSATLTVGGSFEHFQHQLGIGDAETLLVGSPFEYKKNSVLYSPKGMPDPNSYDYTDAILDDVTDLINECGGKTFLLFTSYRSLNIAAERLEDELGFPLLVQGTTSRTELLKRFRELGNAVLLGTGSFWEGIDVKGEALSLVVIDKLPFSSPGDPVMQARINSINRSGGNAFMDYQLPKAVIALKQGVGRLIRDDHDKGVMVISDPRLLTKSYGKKFIDSLPPMAKTRDREKVLGFIRYINKDESPCVND